MENDDGDFVLRDAAGSQRFKIAMVGKTLIIQVTPATRQGFTFMADITEAIALRKWLGEHTTS